MNGSISDGSGASNYSNSASCKWIIAPSLLFRFKLTFTELRLERNDMLRLYSCSDSECTSYSFLSNAWSGTHLPGLTEIPSTRNVALWFKSDASLSNSGFTVSWSPNFPSPPVCALPHPERAFNSARIHDYLALAASLILSLLD
jgi:hypothetical protein